MRTMLITGGSGGIGRVAVRRFLDAGYRVVNVDRQALPINHPNYVCHIVDLRDPIIRDTLDILPHVDVLINNAAVSNGGEFLDMTVEQLREALDVNVVSHTLLAQWFARQFTGEHGRIINVVSTRAFMSEANTIPYSVSKGALVSLTHALAVTLANKRITVNGIAPGWIHTSTDELRPIDHDFHLSKRVGTPDDIASAMLFIADEDNDFLNGEVITVDGGVTKTMIYPE